jgi:chromate transporter
MDSISSLKPTLPELFIAFATTALRGFGGTLPWTRRMMVDERRWMTAEEFNEAFSLCTFLPGANIVNLTVVFGSRVRGPLGSIVALAGLLGPPMVLVMAIGALYARFGDLPAVRHALAGMAAAAAGLIAATAAKMAAPLFKDRAVIAPLIALATAIAVGVMQWSLPVALVVIVPISLALVLAQRFWPWWFGGSDEA